MQEKSGAARLVAATLWGPRVTGSANPAEAWLVACPPDSGLPRYRAPVSPGTEGRMRQIKQQFGALSPISNQSGSASIRLAIAEPLPQILAGAARLELATFGFGDRRSTN